MHRHGLRLTNCLGLTWKCGPVKKRVRHGSDGRHIPRREVLVEGGGAIEHALHGGDGRHIPRREALVEDGVAEEHANHLGLTRQKKGRWVNLGLTRQKKGRWRGALDSPCACEHNHPDS